MTAAAERPLAFPLEPAPVRVPDEQRARILADPGYGRYFTDHVARARWTQERGWYEDRITAFAPLSLSPAAAVLHYGQAVFEGLKAYRHTDGSLWSFRPKDNARRFQDSARRIVLPQLPVDAFLGAIEALVSVDRDWVPDQPESSLYLRPFLYASEAYLGNRAAREVEFCVVASPAASYFAAGTAPISVWVSTDYVRASPGGTGAAKFAGNYAAALAAQAQAAEHDCEHVLYLDAVHRRWVEELGAMNLFAVYDDGTVITPPLSGSILPGVTRSAILTLAADLGHEVHERPIAIDELVRDSRAGRLTELFACGTAAVVAGVGRLCGGDESVTLAEGPDLGRVTAEIRQRLLDIQYGVLPDPHGWLHRWH